MDNCDRHELQQGATGGARDHTHKSFQRSNSHQNDNSMKTSVSKKKTLHLRMANTIVFLNQKQLDQVMVILEVRSSLAVNAFTVMHDHGLLNDEESQMKQPKRSHVVIVEDPDRLQICNSPPPLQISLVTSRFSSSTSRDHKVHCAMRNLHEPRAQFVPRSHRFFSTTTTGQHINGNHSHTTSLVMYYD
jgi:hypothetical protein